MENEKVSKVAETQQLNIFAVSTRLFGVYDRKGIRHRLREKVSILGMPYQKISFREDKWGLLATVYFWGQSRPVSFDRYDIEDKDLWDTIKHSIKSSSNKAKMEFYLRYGKDASKYVKGVNINAL